MENESSGKEEEDIVNLPSQNANIHRLYSQERDLPTNIRLKSTDSDYE